VHYFYNSQSVLYKSNQGTETIVNVWYLISIIEIPTAVCWRSVCWCI